jgi:CRP-like cAMP-binding protein
MRDSHDHIPIERLFALRQHPEFQDADLGELATLAENLVEQRFDTGDVVARPSSRLPALHLVIEGELATAGAVSVPALRLPASSASLGGSDSRTRSRWGARDVFGVLEVLAGRALDAPVIATARTRTYQLAGRDLREVLEDSFGLATSTRRGIARHVLGISNLAMRPGTRQIVVETPAELDLVHRLIVLRQHFPFATLAPLAALAQATVELRFGPGEVIRAEGDRADGILVLLDGAVRAGRTIGVPNDAIGFYELLAERAHVATTEAIAPVRVLHIPEIAIVDIMEDHAELALGTLGLLAGELLDALASVPAGN